MPRRRLKYEDIEILYASVGAVLSQIEAGELTASSATTRRLEGALTALGAVLGDVEGAAQLLLDPNGDSK
jgi:hypothetical protein